ncbi:MAG: hypothetical protein SH857_05580 [Chitinophagales bacterium]|nr:hypothetical protein [Chitinophagales bacterium]
MKNIYLLFLMAFLLLVSPSFAQPFSWTQAASTHGARWEGMSVAVNNKMYVFTGVYTNTSIGQITYQPISEAYNPATNQWTILPQMPVLVTHEGVAGSDGRADLQHNHKHMEHGSGIACCAGRWRSGFGEQ